MLCSAGKFRSKKWPMKPPLPHMTQNTRMRKHKRRREDPQLTPSQRNNRPNIHLHNPNPHLRNRIRRSSTRLALPLRRLLPKPATLP
jgi:hypothetical protein